MLPHKAILRRRLLIGALVAIATCSLCLIGALTVSPSSARVMGLHLVTLLVVGQLVSGAAAVVLGIRWYRIRPRRSHSVTPADIRARAQLLNGPILRAAPSPEPEKPESDEDQAA